ncbi:MAG: zinc-ribbon domain-containing protein [Oscillospiraceae bacterium]|nr:zinc-ribbon domain-containing protein [Oscillospiraceae bacterium]
MHTKYCTRCGSILENGAAFCSECGARVTDATDIQGYGYTSPDDQSRSAAPAESPSFPAEDTSASADGSTAQQGGDEEELSYYNNRKDGSAPASAGWQSADPFSDVPRAPDVQPSEDYWQNAPRQDTPQQTPPAQSWQTPPSAPQSNTGWQQNAGGFQQMNGPAPAPAGSQKTVILILGVVAVVFAVLFPIITYPCAIVGLVLASKAKKAGEEVRNGQILCIIGLVLAILNSVFGALIGIITAIGQLGFYY